ncbi:MAG: OsmC family protein [Gammaproteobacteria bacterium]|nr:OsmC family protein [Gammaproteobacteria bacterium]MCP5459421.1 OsmC family protein [Gammaproteobacteria bacterium]
MENHKVTVRWQRATPDFDYKTYDRSHTWNFPGGQILQGSAAPAFHGDANKVNPEEGLVACLSSCQMLTFLAIAALKGYQVDSYEDEATGEVGKNSRGKQMISRITLRPKVTFSGAKIPDGAALDDLHHKAKESCFVSNSLLTEVILDPR